MQCSRIPSPRIKVLKLNMKIKFGGLLPGLLNTWSVVDFQDYLLLGLENMN